MKQLVFLADIDFTNRPRVRETINLETVEEYAQAYKRKENLPAPVLFKSKDEKHYNIGDGSHRLEAFRSLGRKAVECEVKTGGYQDAVTYAVGSNQHHGLRRTNADKRWCAASALKEWPGASDNRIGEMCGVDPKTVASVRADMEKALALTKTSERTGADGKSYTTDRKPRSKSGEKRDEAADETGFKIPENLMPFWRRRHEVDEVLKRISEIKCFIEKVDKQQDLLWSEPYLDKAVAELESVYANLSAAKPYAVCTICQGHPELQNDQCRGCKGRGFMSKFRWARASDRVKELRGVK